MAIRVISVPSPAVGHDWTFKIPGQWTAHLLGVKADLVTGANVSTIPDESGNGRTGTVQANTRARGGFQGPYAAGLNNYSVYNDGLVGPTDFVYCLSASGIAALSLLNGTLEAWIKPALAQTGHRQSNGLGILDNSTPLVRVGGGVRDSQVSPADGDIVSNGAFRFNPAGIFTRNVWHHYALTWDTINFRTYVDGALVSTNAGQQPGANAIPQAWAGGASTNGQMNGFQAGAAIYGAALAQANIQNHFNASSSWAAYRAAVLVDTPLLFWGLNTVVSGPSRTVDLVITDGTNKVGEYAASFPATTAPVFTWSWQPLGSGALGSTDGVLNSVPIPDMTLPAGYTIGTRTLDITGTDQWSNITLWFDDGTGPTVGPGAGGAQYLNARLVPEFVTGG